MLMGRRKTVKEPLEEIKGELPNESINRSDHIRLTRNLRKFFMIKGDSIPSVASKLGIKVTELSKILCGRDEWNTDILDKLLKVYYISEEDWKVICSGDLEITDEQMVDYMNPTYEELEVAVIILTFNGYNGEEIRKELGYDSAFMSGTSNSPLLHLRKSDSEELRLGLDEYYILSEDDHFDIPMIAESLDGLDDYNFRHLRDNIFMMSIKYLKFKGDNIVQINSMLEPSGYHMRTYDKDEFIIDSKHYAPYTLSIHRDPVILGDEVWMVNNKKIIINKKHRQEVPEK